MPGANAKVGQEKPDIKKTPEYRRFKALLRKVIKAAPMPRKKQPQMLHERS
jgi:hypothetical protein